MAIVGVSSKGHFNLFVEAHFGSQSFWEVLIQGERGFSEIEANGFADEAFFGKMDNGNRVKVQLCNGFNESMGQL